MFSKKMLNRSGDSGYPRLTSTLGWKKVPLWLSINTSLAELLYGTSTTCTRPSSMSNFDIASHSPSWQLTSKTFLKSIKFLKMLFN